MSDWIELAKYFSKIGAQYNSGNISSMNKEDLTILNALTGTENSNRIDQAINGTNRSESSIEAIAKAAHRGGPESALQSLFDIEGTLARDYGIGLEVMPVTHGNFVEMKIRASGQGENGQQFRKEWSLPISQNGHIFYNNQERNDMLHAVADSQGRLQLLNTAEAAIKSVFNQLTYEGNKKVIKGINSTSPYQQYLGWNRLNRIFGQEINQVVSGGSATNPYNARQLQELREAMKVNGSAYRREVTKGGVNFGNMFSTILNDYFKGKGSFEEQEISKDRYNQKLKKMALITSAMGVKRGWEVIKHTSEFSDILSDQKLAIPVLYALGNLAGLELQHGPVTDTHGMDMAYLNNVPNTFIDFAQSSSRKPQQATLNKTNFYNQNRGNAFGTKGRF